MNFINKAVTSSTKDKKTLKFEARFWTETCQ